MFKDTESNALNTINVGKNNSYGQLKFAHNLSQRIKFCVVSAFLSAIYSSSGSSSGSSACSTSGLCDHFVLRVDHVRFCAA